MASGVKVPAYCHFHPSVPLTMIANKHTCPRCEQEREEADDLNYAMKMHDE